MLLRADVEPSLCTVSTLTPRNLVSGESSPLGQKRGTCIARRYWGTKSKPVGNLERRPAAHCQVFQPLPAICGSKSSCPASFAIALTQSSVSLATTALSRSQP
jgi:hypothetical protein